MSTTVGLMSLTSTLSPELEAHVSAVRAWSVEHVRPVAREADRRHRPPDDWPAILDACPVPITRKDRRDLPAPPVFPDGGWVEQLAITEAICTGDIWVNDVIGQGIGHLTVHLMGTPEQSERWYRSIVRSGGVAAFALTEPGFGSDTSMVSTTASRDGDTWCSTARRSTARAAPARTTWWCSRPPTVPSARAPSPRSSSLAARRG